MSSRKTPPPDEAIWRAYKAGVIPHKTRKPRVRTEKPLLPETGHAGKTMCPSIIPVAVASKKMTVSNLPVLAGAAAPDRDESRKLRLGDVRIGARIDLHGMTQAKAHHALAAFMDRAMVSGKRTLLVITGQGADGMGVLKRSVPDWLWASPWANAIRYITPAAAKHGGSGAYYVVVRKTSRTKA